MNKKWLCIVIAIIGCLFSCNLGFTPTSQYYYIQQAEEVEETVTAPSEDIEVDLNYMFDILEAEGTINRGELEALLSYYQDELKADEKLLETFLYQIYELPIIRKEADSNFPQIDLKGYDFSDKLIQATFTSKNVPTMSYVTGDSWLLSDDIKYLPPVKDDKNNFTYEYSGKNTSAGVNSITNVTYLKYEGYNPFYAIDSKYNQAKLVDGNKRGMERFIFYRFKGKGGGLVDLDNMLVAVDTYTSLIFSYAVPTEFFSILGQDNPTKWEPVEVAATAPDGQKYKFYEYDPAGYIDTITGNFVMYDWYINNLSNANASNPTNFYPQFTGVSPYLINFEVKKPTFKVNPSENLVDTDSKYYTELSNFAFDTPPGTVDAYNIYRIDDSSTERKLIKTINVIGANLEEETYKDKNALILTKNPQYSIEAIDENGNIIGSASDLLEGKRTLTDREVVLASIETMRYALIDNNAHGSVTGKMTVSDASGGTFDYKKTGLFTATYIYTLIDYMPNFLSLSTVKDHEVTYQSKGLLTSIQTSTEFTGSIDVKDRGVLLFNNIEISNNDKDAPDWSSGTLDYTVGSKPTIPYTSTDIPFGFYMTKDAFITAILGDNNEYEQE